MRKTKLLLFVALLCMVGVIRAVETSDHVVIGELTVSPGNNEGSVLTLSLEGSVKYTAFQMSLELPVGLEVCYSDGYYQVYKSSSSGFYPQMGEAHSLGANVVDGMLNVACFSSSNAEFSNTSGELFKVHVKASPYLKPGPLEIKVKDVKLVTVDEVKYEPADYVSTSVEAAATSTLSLRVSETNKYSTCILPFDYQLPTDGSLVAYSTDSYTTDVLLLTKVEEMKAYTPYILYSEGGFSVTISGKVETEKYPEEGTVKNGLLVGAVTAQTLTAGSYVMQNQGSGCMFYRVGSTPFILAAGKCYVEMPDGTAAPSFRIGGTTAINSAHNSESNQNSIYNVMGQRVRNMTSGQIYVIDNKKVIAK